jgi:hypothetical protein
MTIQGPEMPFSYSILSNSVILVMIGILATLQILKAMKQSIHKSEKPPL